MRHIRSEDAGRWGEARLCVFAADAFTSHHCTELIKNRLAAKIHRFSCAVLHAKDTCRALHQFAATQ